MVWSRWNSSCHKADSPKSEASKASVHRRAISKHEDPQDEGRQNELVHTDDYGCFRKPAEDLPGEDLGCHSSLL